MDFETELPLAGSMIMVIIASTIMAVCVLGFSAYGGYVVYKRRESRQWKKISKENVQVKLHHHILEEISIGESSIMSRSWSSSSSVEEGGSFHGALRSPEKEEMLCQLETIREPDTEPTSSENSTSYLGSLHFSVVYDTSLLSLLVSVQKCVRLTAKNGSDKSLDPYIKVQILPSKTHRVKTRVLRKTQNPSFEETFNLNGISQGDLQNSSLHFVILSFDRFSRDEVLGEVVYPLNELDPTSTNGISLEKEIQYRQCRSTDGHSGEILVSLCYQPVANRLTVVILKARQLPKMDITGLAGDPFVKIYLVNNQTRIAKKKTRAKKRTLNPVYNEAFAFELPQRVNMRTVSVELIVRDADRLAKSEVLGRLQLGIGFGDIIERHWLDVLQNPRKQIAEWHRLHS